jgi:uroporphyrinogen decarboxylase
MAYNKLKAALGFTGGHTRVYDVVQQLAQPEDAMLGAFGVDVLDIGRAFNTSDDDWYDITLSDGSAAQYRSGSVRSRARMAHARSNATA